MDISKCSSSYDLVTMVEWVDDIPNIFIDFYNDPQKPGRLNCYNGESLRYWLNLPENTFAKWVKNPLSKEMDASGHGGKPDLEYKYIKLYTGEFIVYDELAKKLLKSKDPVIIKAIYTSTERIGNLRGTLGVSELHGQLPGERIYKLEGEIVEIEVEETIPQIGDHTELLRNILRLIYFEDDDDILGAIKEYMKVSSNIEIRGLPLKMVLEFRYDDHNYKSNVTALMDEYRKAVHSSFERYPEYNLDKDDNSMQIINCISNLVANEDIITKEYQIINIIDKYQIPDIPEMYIIESVLRSETLDPSLINIYSKDMDSKKSFRKKCYRIMVERAVIIKYNTIRMIEKLMENSKWGYKEDYNKYRQIISRGSNVPDTIETMIQYYRLEFE